MCCEGSSTATRGPCLRVIAGITINSTDCSRPPLRKVSAKMHNRAWATLLSAAAALCMTAASVNTNTAPWKRGTDHCPPCSIVADRLLRLRAGPGNFTPDFRFLSVIHQRNGRFVVAPLMASNSLAVYDSDGAFAETIARLSMSHAGDDVVVGGIWRMAMDSILVSDLMHDRLLVLTPILQVARTARFFGNVIDVTNTPTGFVLAAKLAQPGMIHTFGFNGHYMQTLAGTKATDTLARLQVAYNPATGETYALQNNQYVVRRWNRSGSPEQPWDRRAAWFPEYPTTSRGGAHPFVADISGDGDGRLWVLVVATGGFRNAAGVPGMPSAADGSHDVQSIIEVLDPQHKIVMGSLRVSGYVRGMCGEREAFSTELTKQGATQIVIWRFGPVPIPWTVECLGCLLPAHGNPFCCC